MEKDWEDKIDESREKHQHPECSGGINDVGDGFKLMYCVECDLFYEVKK